MLTERNVQKYYPETIETAKGHLNQTRKNVWTTKVKATLLETCNTSHLHGKKVCDVYSQMYMVQETTFPTKQASSPSDLFIATNTSWSWWKSTATPSLLKP